MKVDHSIQNLTFKKSTIDHALNNVLVSVKYCSTLVRPKISEYKLFVHKELQTFQNNLKLTVILL